MPDSPTTAPQAVWFRQDLRVHDHAPLCDAAAVGPVHCVYVLDPRDFEGTRERGLRRTGPFRARFLLESLADLRTNLRRLGGELIVRRGRPEEVLPELARRHGWKALHFHDLVGTEEQEVEDEVVDAVKEVGCEPSRCWDRTLVHVDELPFGVWETPEVFTAFRKKVEALGGFTEPLPEPPRLEKGADHPDPGAIPGLEELGLDAPPDDERSVLRFEGGETAGKVRLAHYLWEEDCLRRYKDTRNRMVGADYSSKFSPWLAHGCLSPRWIQAEVERYERERVSNKSTYWMTFELLWRDYFQMIAAKHGRNLFRASGLQGVPVPWKADERGFEAWCRGETGFPLVDANMRELAASGFMSNRGRQNVASFLTKNLGIDWRWGAEWFESLLIDHDVASNYGNWNYTAGVGNDARGFRYFNIPTQAEKYDRRGKHAKLWCPELEPLDEAHVHSPWTLTRKQQEQIGVVLGRDYPEPILDLTASVRENERAWKAAMNAP